MSENPHPQDRLDLVVLRHGETDWNADGRYQGRRNVPLNETGRQQIQRVARCFADDHPDIVSRLDDYDFVTSPLSRADQTMAALAAALHVARVDSAEALVERDYGRWEGWTRAEIKARYPDERRRHRDEPWHFRPPDGGESYADLSERVGGWLVGLQRSAVIASHAGVIRVLAHRLGGLAKDKAASLPVPHCAVFRFTMRQPHGAALKDRAAAG